MDLRPFGTGETRDRLRASGDVRIGSNLLDHTVELHLDLLKPPPPHAEGIAERQDERADAEAEPVGLARRQIAAQLLLNAFLDAALHAHGHQPLDRPRAHRAERTGCGSSGWGQAGWDIAASYPDRRRRHLVR